MGFKKNNKITILLILLVILNYTTEVYSAFNCNTILTDEPPSSLINIGASIQLKKNKTLQIDPSITLFEVSTIELFFTSTDNDITAIELNCPYGYNQKLITSPPHMELAFNAFNTTIIPFDLYFNSTIPTHLPISFNVTGNYGILTLEKLHIRKFSLEIHSEQNKNNWQLLKKRMVVWNLAISQTWSKLQIEIPLTSALHAIRPKIKQPVLKFNWSYVANTKLTLDSATLKYATNEQVTIQENKIVNHYYSSYSSIKFIFNQNYAFKQVNIKITLNIWYKSSQTNYSLFDIETIPFLPPWLSLPVGIIIMIVPMAGVSKRTFSDKQSKMNIKTKNVE